MALTGKLAVVTGGSRGIGMHVARALHKAGAIVVITGRDEETLADAATQIGERCLPYVCDQRNPQMVRSACKAILQDLGSPDILVCNAGLMRGGTVAEMSLDLWNDVIQTNLTGTFLTVQGFLSEMIDKGRADIFLISSMSGKKGDPGAAAYAASKFGLQGFAQSLMYEVRRHQIRVMVLNPSSVDTGPDTGKMEGPGLHLHAADLASLIVHLAVMPGRTMVRDMDIYGTNP